MTPEPDALEPEVPELSVVIATYNRPDGIVEVLRDLDAQEGFAPGAFEVVVVDDGSAVPVRARVEALALRYPVRVEAQANAGQAAARHRGMTLARGAIVVVLDDDMRLAPTFLAAHRAAHAAGADVVQGAIVPPDGPMPLYERWHAEQLTRMARDIADGVIRYHGDHMATGNISLRRQWYFDVGGFDRDLKRSEDRDLGIRLERAGARLAFSADARSVHHSDHASLASWLRRSFDYGVYDTRIARKHPDVARVDPWSFLFAVNPVSRPVLATAVVAPWAGKAVSRTALAAALLADRLRLRRLAMAGTTFVYGLEYFRGVRAAAGSIPGAARGLGRYLVKRSRATLRAGRGAPIAAWADFRHALATDWSVMTEGRAKYLGEGRSRWWLADVVTKIGLQMVYAVRVMRLLRDSGLRTGARVASRVIRHAYAAELHWDAEFAPGVSVIHGNGLVVSHAARVGEGCVLCHNVTLGMGVDPLTGEMGAPTLERNVHVGPGATLLGPIVVGEGSKVMAGSVLAQSVPPNSLVRPAQAEVVVRERARGAAVTRPTGEERGRPRAAGPSGSASESRAGDPVAVGPG